jgi:hypothetical protein
MLIFLKIAQNIFFSIENKGKGNLPKKSSAQVKPISRLMGKSECLGVLALV